MDAAEPLYVTCRTCGSEVATPFVLSSAVYEIPPDEPHDLTCPTCGRTASYTRRDFHLHG